ncbi:MAG: GNAT family N-acetyltransferase [Firmicutes bacterium]|nr:GNAT family N-acetyltransferase [Bacillota bacterium]
MPVQGFGCGPFRIRIAGPADAETICRITREAFSEFEGRVHPPFRALAETPELIRDEMADGFVYALAAAGREPAGHVRYRLRPGYVHVSRLAVLPDYRGHGAGRKLMSWVEDEARRLGVALLRGEVRTCMDNLLNYYLAMGYEPVGTRSLAGVPACLTIIEKRLNASPKEPDDEPIWVEEQEIAWELLHPALAALLRPRTH